jgi:hypothetical protein
MKDGHLAILAIGLAGGIALLLFKANKAHAAANAPAAPPRAPDPFGTLPPLQIPELRVIPGFPGLEVPPQKAPPFIPGVFD